MAGLSLSRNDDGDGDKQLRANQCCGKEGRRERGRRGLKEGKRREAAMHKEGKKEQERANSGRWSREGRRVRGSRAGRQALGRC